MEKELILLNEYCRKSRAELDFILRLESEGLIETEVQGDARYISLSQLSDLDMFTRLYYDLSINIEGIDVINNMLGKMRKMEHELSVLRRQLDAEPFFGDDFFDEF
ncbi:hypothetical protein D0T49_08280 [Paludibacter sp. 221]|uniref:chaperone modulator CbpM n=1 Tax=Paludibacter sp. 221 TaxID=2302939 RepID=UPI0013D72BC4|nr:chaperone modulator CbpM [Paludibacter sp. 221]NDV47044.1 hypothetical protein [Paludibacter sp. 221]